MAELLVAASVPRQGSAAVGDEEDAVDDLYGGGSPTKKFKLRREATKPTDIYSWFEITLQDINVPSQTFTASIEIHLFWQDYNLPNVIPTFEEKEFEIHDDSLPIKMSEIFENKVSCDVDGDVEYNYYKETGTIYMKMVVNCTFVERMELQRFPLDRQFMNMAFNAYVSEPAIQNEGPWNWICDYPEWMPSELKEFNKPFAVRMLSSITEYELLQPWVDFSGEQPLSIRLRVNRLPTYYFGNIIFPNFLIVAGCFSAFVIPREDIADRLSVTVTLMLAAVAFRFIVSTMLPKVSYLTIMDYYLLIGFIALIFLIAENAIAGIPSLDKAGAAIDLWCAILFGSYVYILSARIINNNNNNAFSLYLAMWITVHIIALLALLRKECLRVSWEEMDRIDSTEDEEEEFVYAENEFVKGKNESEQGKSDWKKYRKYTVMERADVYAKTNNIKRSGTFQKKLSQEQRRKVTENLGKIYEEAVVEEEKKDKNKKDEGDKTTTIKDENVEIYVPSKLKKVEPKKKKQEDNIAASIQLSQQTKPVQDVKPKKEPKYQEPKQEPKQEEEPKYQEPKQEEPKQEEPKQEEPKYEEPKEEEPKEEEPKKEEPKEEEPKYEEPKEEEEQVTEVVIDENEDENKNENDDKDKAEYIAQTTVETGDNNEEEETLIKSSDTNHGYTETVIVNQDPPKDDDDDDDDNDNDDDDNNNDNDEEYVQVNTGDD